MTDAHPSMNRADRYGVGSMMAAAPNQRAATSQRTAQAPKQLSNRNECQHVGVRLAQGNDEKDQEDRSADGQFIVSMTRGKIRV